MQKKLLVISDIKLLEQALTHRSYVNENPGATHNERLEFLGDALLTFLSADYLYRRYPDIEEDELTRWRSFLVDEKQLANYALIIGLDTKMRLGMGAIRDGGFTNPRLQSCTFEALVGAYYIDRGRDMEAVRPVVESFFDAVMPDVKEPRSNVDSKNQFQEWVQHKIGGGAQPEYVTKRSGGAEHAPKYRSQVYVNGQLYGEGKGTGKKDAEKWAAEDALSKLRDKRLL